MRKRVLLAGLFHETHTFLEERTGWDQFQLRRGRELFDARGDGSPLAGVLDAADAAGWELIPAVDLRATPSGIVEDSVLERFWDALKETALPALRDGVDGIYLVLHGAMASESHRDVEGEVLRRIRSLPPAAGIPVCGVLDLHGNISRNTIAQTQGFVAYRTNPHADASDAARDAARHLDRILTTGHVPVGVWAQPPVMWPPTGTGTDDLPMRALEDMAREIEHADPDVAFVNVFAGFSFADTESTGVSFSAVTFGEPQAARAKLQPLVEWTVAHAGLGNVIEPPLEQILPRIGEHVRKGECPVAIVEPSDNIGGGAPGDAPTVLRALIEGGIENAAVVINDPQAVSLLRGLQIGTRSRLAIGGRASRLTDPPLLLDVDIISLSDGRFELEDRRSHLASVGGVHVDMGPSAVVRHKGVRILLTSRKTPPFDLGQLRSQGIEPESLDVVGVKAAVGHRRAYDRITRASYTVATPGPCSSDLRTLPYRHIRRPIFPLDDL